MLKSWVCQTITINISNNHNIVKVNLSTFQVFKRISGTPMSDHRPHILGARQEFQSPARICGGSATLSTDCIR